MRWNAVIEWDGRVGQCRRFHGVLDDDVPNGRGGV